MKTIAVIANVGWSVYNFRHGIIKYFLDKGYKVIVFTKFDSYIIKLEELGCQCIPLKRMDFKGMNPFNDVLLTFGFYRLFKTHKIDVALFYTPKVNIFGSIAARYSKTKYIPTINGLGTIFNPNQNIVIQKIVTSLYRIALFKAPKVIFQNSDDRDFFLEKKIIATIDKTIVVKGSGVNLNDFYQKKYLPNQSNLVLAFAARLLKEKGIFEFIEAASIVKKTYPNIEFAIIGSSNFFPGNIDEEKISEAEKNGIISFWGGTDNMSATLDKVDVLILPSYYREGVPRILIEGLSKGLPLITTHNVGCKETVDDGINGYLIETKNSLQLAEAMTKMIQLSVEERIQMGHASRRKAENECAEDIIFQEYENIVIN